MDGRLLIIGDVHGMLDALRQLVGELDIQPSDTLVFVGDLIDKGPDSIGVLSYVEALRRHASFEVILVEGNHEDRMRRYLRNRKVRPKVATEQATHTPELEQLSKQLTAERLAFLDWSVPFFHCKSLDVLVVHGGIPGTMSTFPASIEAAKSLTGRKAKSFEKIFRTRYVDAASGKFLALGAQRPDDPFWAETYDGRFGHVVFGHQPFLEGPAEFPYATGIDTGAVHGGGLTALVCAPDAPRRFLTVQSDCVIPQGECQSIGKRYFYDKDC
jgi:aryl carrier-like protein|tara:strand:- start:9114 stop:9926 length:813 start_codon:yes stop_codon:yes gene_type:complete